MAVFSFTFFPSWELELIPVYTLLRTWLGKKGEDRLSQLPDEILDHILSYLPMQEASRTSVLSASWRHRWLFVGNFDFNTRGFIKPKDRNINVGALTDRFFNRVDMVLQSHRGRAEALPLQKLRIQFPLDMDKHLHGKIDEWMSYAFAKRVRVLELDFLPHCDLNILNPYRFPMIRLVAETENMSFLRSLSLSGVSVSKQDLNSILLNCHSLDLKVLGTKKLKSVEIGSSCPALKHVEILNCYKELEHVVVRDTCLVSLTLGIIPDLEVVNNPMLVSLTFDCVLKYLAQENNPKLVSACFSYWDPHFDPAFRLLCLSRLHTLTLCLRNTDAEVFDEVPELSELKHLTLIVAPLLNRGPLRLTSLLRLSPNLEKLVLELVVRVAEYEGKLEYEKGSKVVLPRLKAVEVRGYCGKEAEDELIRYALEHVVAPIRTIIFDPRLKSSDSHAELLKKVIPSSVEFIVLQSRDEIPHFQSPSFGFNGV